MQVVTVSFISMIHVCQGWKIQNTCIKNSVQLTFSFQCLSAVAPLPSSECQPTGKKEKKKETINIADSVQFQCTNFTWLY